ncbi:Uncharacterized MFS-type transporter Rv2994, partial [Aduncisulcus paluster]
MVTMVHVDEVGTARRWAMLAIALGSTAGANVFINGVAFLIPALHTERGLNLANAGLLSAMPSFGMVLTLIAWGALVDRFGERIALVSGLALTALAAFAAAEAPSLVITGVFLLLGGAAAAACNSASGRVVVGWFPPHQRGTVMGIRQMAQPLGVALGALVIPRIAEGHGVATALLFPAVVCAVSSVVCLVGIIDPPRPPRSEAPQEHLANPYRGSRMLWLIHAVSVLLVVPQVVVWTFTLVWLVTDRGWSIGAASVMVTVAQLPIRTIAAAASATMALLAITNQLDWSISVVVMLAASVITVSDNGLAYTSIAEIAGPFWSGRALGAQNTGQLLTAAVAPPVFGALASVAGFSAVFAVCALFPLAAVGLVP